jgi:hypothetical protein
MRAILTIAAVAATLATMSTAKAQTNMNTIPYYPWCAVETGNREGHEGRSCGFTSYAQCQNYVRGQNGICFENIWGPKPANAVRSDERPARRR